MKVAQRTLSVWRGTPQNNAAFDFTWDENEGFELVDYDSAKNRFHTGRRWQRSNWHHRRNQNDRNRYKQSAYSVLERSCPLNRFASALVALPQRLKNSTPSTPSPADS